MWQKDDDGIQRSQQEAFDYCTDLSLAGFTDWRLPHLAEFRRFETAGGFTRSLHGGGDSEYWTATPGLTGDTAYTSEGLTFYRDLKFYVLAVRNHRPGDT